MTSKTGNSNTAGRSRTGDAIVAVVVFITAMSTLLIGSLWMINLIWGVPHGN